MISSLRHQFNTTFSATQYQQLVAALEHQFALQIEFRISETPVFLPTEFVQTMVQAAQELNQQLFTAEYLAASERAIPADFYAPNQNAHPNFIQTDFAVTRNAKGELIPQLVELQGCASVHAFQLALAQAYQKYFNLAHTGYLLSDLTDERYLSLLRQTICGAHSATETILMEIEPEQQKTRPDFVATEQMLGVKTVAIDKIYKQGNRLFYRAAGKEIQIQRIYNRAIVDELVRKNISIGFDYRDDLAVEWAGHPNWFFRLSKFSLPYLQHPCVPRSWFLHQLENVPSDLENFVLKPLFSFAGSGVKVNVTPSDLEQISVAERPNYLLQEKIHYEPVIETPEDPAKVEIRVMFLWPDKDAQPTPAMMLGRMSKGAMMGVDFNKNKTWVGASACLWNL